MRLSCLSAPQWRWTRDMLPRIASLGKAHLTIEVNTDVQRNFVAQGSLFRTRERKQICDKS